MDPIPDTAFKMAHWEENSLECRVASQSENVPQHMIFHDKNKLQEKKNQTSVQI